jgi:hypothetical protein
MSEQRCWTRSPGGSRPWSLSSILFQWPKRLRRRIDLAAMKVKAPAKCTRCGENRRDDDDTHDCPLKRYFTLANPAKTKDQMHHILLWIW